MYSESTRSIYLLSDSIISSEVGGHTSWFQTPEPIERVSLSYYEVVSLLFLRNRLLGEPMSDLLSEIVFTDLEGVRVPVTLNNKKYWLVEATVDAVNKFKSEVSKGIKFDSNGRPTSITSIGDTETFLLSRCLYYANKDGGLTVDDENNPIPKDLVPLQKIKTWKSQVQEGLVKRLKAISDLDQTEETEESLQKLMDETLKKLQKIRESKRNSEDELLKND